MIISVEGNIGSGKTSLLEQIEQILAQNSDISPKKIHIFYEGVNEWCNLRDSTGNSIFELYYNDPYRYSYVFQSYVMSTRMTQLAKLRDQYPNDIILCERTHESDYNIFVMNLVKQKKLTEIEYLVYKQLLDTMKNSLNLHVNYIIYNDVKPDICKQRISTRNRHGEEGITLGFLENLHEFHENWLKNSENVFLLDGSCDKNSDIRSEQIKTIIKFINNL